MKKLLLTKLRNFVKMTTTIKIYIKIMLSKSYRKYATECEINFVELIEMIQFNEKFILHC